MQAAETAERQGQPHRHCRHLGQIPQSWAAASVNTGWRLATRFSHWRQRRTYDSFVAQSRQILKSVVRQLVGQFQIVKLVEAGAG